MKRATILTLLLAMLVLPVTCGDAQFSKVVTLTTSTLTRVFNTRTMASSVLIQMLHGGTALGYVYSSNPAAACNTNNLLAELAPATATAPGGSYTDSGVSLTQQGGADISWICVSGTTSDTMLVAYRSVQ